MSHTNLAPKILMKLSQIQESAAMEMIEANPDVVVDRDTYMSGAYIRSLVKQLTTSSSSSSAASSSSSSSSPPPTPPKNSLKSRPKAAAPHKKQVRRRLHTTRPYQERLLNMAEARKEIVTALKFHRASMKHQQQQQQLGPPSPPPVQVGAKAELPSFYIAPPPPPLLLPNQTLGLSLNLDAACLYTNNNNNNNNVARSPLSVGLSDHREMMTVVVDDRDQQGLGSEGSRAVGDQEMAEIKSIGEMHEMEWNDTVNLATSAWWFNFLHKTESEDEFDTSPCVDPHQLIEHAVEFPLLWEGGKDPTSSLDANFELPCMKIEDIEGLDEEWLY